MKKNALSRSDEAKNYNYKIAKRIQSILDDKSISQKDLADKLGRSTATVSKWLTGKTSLTLPILYTICRMIEIDINDLFKDDSSAPNNTSASTSYATQLSSQYGQKYDQEYLITDPCKTAFRGILNNQSDQNDCYFFYTKPTISNEKKGFLKGTLRLSPSKDQRSCIAHLKLKTGQKDENGKDIIKEYLGSLMISLPTNSCYIDLVSEESCDKACLSFSHMFFNRKKLLIRLVACLTTSAGGNRRPVFTKAIISRVELNDKQLNEIAGQLYINNSVISIRKDVLEEKSQNDPNILDQLKSIEHVESGDLPYIQYYNIKEKTIRCSSLTSDEQQTLINKLRFISSSPYYCKISRHSDELLFEYISNLEARNNSISQE